MEHHPAAARRIFVYPAHSAMDMAGDDDDGRRNVVGRVDEDGARAQ